MVQATDIRIGNLLMQSGEVITVTSSIIASIESGDVFEPIPITKEWLIDLGFHRSLFQTNEYFFYDGYFVRFKEKYILFGENKAHAVLVDYSSIHFIHELQNIHYGLCKRELKLPSAVQS